MVKKILVGLITVILILSLAGMALAANGLAGKKIYVDPGHGGDDPGAVGANGLKEKTVNLRVATVLKNCLVEYGGATVRMSRTTDKTVSLSARVTDANNWGPPVLSVSIIILPATARLMARKLILIVPAEPELTFAIKSMPSC